MMVAMPPKLEAYAITIIIQNEKFLILLESIDGVVSTILMTARAMGNIIMVVAVLLSHILKNPVEIINPRITLLPLVPVIFIIFNAIRLCKFHFSIARLRKIHP